MILFGRIKVYLFAYNLVISKPRNQTRKMAKSFHILILLFTFQLMNSQVTERVYVKRGNNYSTIYSYFVEEIYIFSDSTFKILSYMLPNKKEREKYKGVIPTKREGKISRKGKFYILTEFSNGERTEKLEYSKITNRKISFYLKNENSYEKICCAKRKSKASL